VAPSYQSIPSACAASAAGAVAKRKEEKYTDTAKNYHFFPIDFDTFCPINQVGADFYLFYLLKLSDSTKT
jgi:hypothetical protein